MEEGQLFPFHVEEAWIESQLCLRCGDSAHKVATCPHAAAVNPNRATSVRVQATYVAYLKGVQLLMEKQFANQKEYLDKQSSTLSGSVQDKESSQSQSFRSNEITELNSASAYTIANITAK
ncbi:hypothetical protein QBC46DRAFT_414209 [Diplogelasinospora grovesii]|uniref:Uncharacterized protein n=1 Tax=Diplogelasinospora grovesii TaxID=303347 RepID=A0AAN6RZ30_9PEZI|nr:hypothetical protein QBC46DRAFT_414209 [Diplogelasinospora grovesii]